MFWLANYGSVLSDFTVLVQMRIIVSHEKLVGSASQLLQIMHSKAEIDLLFLFLPTEQ